MKISNQTNSNNLDNLHLVMLDGATFFVIPGNTLQEELKEDINLKLIKSFSDLDEAFAYADEEQEKI